MLGETKKNSWVADLAGMVPTVGPILSGIINRIQSRGDIGRQNEYNSPANQLARLREAGLPMGAMTGAVSGTQSALPQTSGAGIQEGTKNLGQFFTTQMQLKQLEILNSEIQLKESEAAKNKAEVTWLLEGKGEDRQGTNLTRGLSQSYNIGESGLQKQAAETAGQKISNDINTRLSENQSFRLDAENKQIQATTEKILKDNNLIDEKIESENINQKIQNVLEKYTERLTTAQLGNLLKQNELIGEHITGAELDNKLKVLENYFRKATIGNEILTSNIDTQLKQLMSDKAYNEFKMSKGYNDMVNKARGLWDNPNLSVSERGDALGALIYTTIVGSGGGADIPMPGLIIGGIGTGGAGVKKYDPMKDKNNLDKRKFYKK